MTKLFTLLFTALSLGAVWLTYNDTGLQTVDVSQDLKSVRSGSTGVGGFYGGGYQHGK